jgi:hypothetical protein
MLTFLPYILNIKLNKYGQLMYGKKVSIYLLCLILMSMSSYKPNLNCLSSDVLPYMPQLHYHWKMKT